MTIDNNTVVSLHYKLSNQQTGEQLEETLVDRPMQFLYGIERIIPTFEENIHGKGKGDKMSFGIPAADAYGTRTEDQVVNIPLNVFQDESGKINEEHIFVGALLPMTDNEGRHLRGRILEINAEDLKMDFNHPLAGIDLLFDIEILDVRPATQDEIAHGHSHGEHGHHH